MRTISLRQFRTDPGAIAEPVAVVVRRSGEFITLGTWTPHGVPKVDQGSFEAVKPVHVAPLPAPRPFTPAPKPGKR